MGPRASRGSRFADLAVVPLRALAALLSSLPLRWAQRAGAMLGALWYHLVPIRRRVVHDNIALAFPGLPRRQRARIAAGCFRHVATTVMELLWLARPSRELLEGIVDVEGLEHYEAASRQGRGTIAVTAHLGNFDLLACSQALAGVPLAIVTKELSSEGLSALWMERRSAAGVRLLGSRGSIRSILGALRKGDVVGLVVDQRTPEAEGGKALPFFGAPALTTQAPAVLAARTGAALVPVMTFRRADGRHHVRVFPELEPARNVAETTATINRTVERWIRWHPEQWLWHHRRWRR